MEQVTRIVPPPAQPAPRAWDEVEARLGTALPQDFKDLVDTYGGGAFDETIRMLEPDCADRDDDLLAMKEERPEDWTVLANAGRGPEWEHHTVQSTRFVLSAITGEIHSGIRRNSAVQS
ncbi:SMI1/KNR4 family protein [Streptomyces sp. NPDC051771]|uniref:SMI1/KNR4 family protein n=1 Tax=Streptomyces sp. NPDC051771 TaxID=3154847 RepID=UPI00343AD984